MPVNPHTMRMLRICFHAPRRLPPSGIYTYSRNQVPSEMCQRRQNSVTERAIYGYRKFSRNSNPNIRPRPMAISEYPEKSK